MNRRGGRHGSGGSYSTIRPLDGAKYRAGRELSYVEVGVVLYNADGQRINESFTNTTDMPIGEEWVFEIMLTEDASEIDDYTIGVTDSPF